MRLPTVELEQFVVGRICGLLLRQIDLAAHFPTRDQEARLLVMAGQHRAELLVDVCPSDGHRRQVTIIKTTSQHRCEAVKRIERAKRPQSPTRTKDRARWYVFLTGPTFYS